MKTYWQLYKVSIRNFRIHYQKYLGYMLVSNLILFVLLIPAFRLFFNLIIKSKGYNYITNGMLQKFLTSPQGIIIVLSSILVGSVVIILEFGGVVVISHQTLTDKKESRFIDILRYSSKKLKYLISFDGLLIIIYFIILAPLLDNNLKASIFQHLKIPGFIMSVITSNSFYLAMLFLLVFVIIILSIRWMFSLHVLLIDDHVDKRFLKTSSKLIKGNLKTIIKYWFFTFLFEVLMLLGLVLVLLVMSFIVMTIFPVSEPYIIIVLLSIGFVLLMALTTVSSTINLIRMTQLYHMITDKSALVLDIKTIEKSTWLNRLLSNKVLVLISIILVSIGSYLYMYLVYNGFSDAYFDVEITAHRGSSLHAPENTMSAIKMAIDHGVDYIEIDVQLTKDNVLILHHDETFKRVAGVNFRSDQMTLKEIESLEVGSWFDEKYRGEKVAKLQDVIDVSKGKVNLNIEIKGSQYSPNIYTALKEIIDLNRLNCVITSIKYEDLLEMETIDSSLKTGYIMFVAIGDLSDLATDFYSIEASNVTETFVSKAHALGREVHVWTINDKILMQEMLELGVDNIITDDELLLKSLIEELTVESYK